MSQHCRLCVPVVCHFHPINNSFTPYITFYCHFHCSFYSVDATLFHAITSFCFLFCFCLFFGKRRASFISTTDTPNEPQWTIVVCNANDTLSIYPPTRWNHITKILKTISLIEWFSMHRMVINPFRNMQCMRATQDLYRMHQLIFFIHIYRRILLLWHRDALHLCIFECNAMPWNNALQAPINYFFSVSWSISFEIISIFVKKNVN